MQAQPTRVLRLDPPTEPVKPQIIYSAGELNTVEACSMEEAEQGILTFKSNTRNGMEITSRLYGIHAAKVLYARISWEKAEAETQLEKYRATL